jgi:hypothetical protein
MSLTACMGAATAPAKTAPAPGGRPTPANSTSAILGTVKIEITGPSKQTLIFGLGSYGSGFHGTKGLFLNFGNPSLMTLSIALPANATPGTYTIVAESASQPFAPGSYRNEKGTLIRYDKGKTVSGNLNVTLEAKGETAITFTGSFNNVQVSGRPS